MKTETCKLYSRDFWIFLPEIIKIDLYNSELYRFKVGAFFRHSVDIQDTRTKLMNTRVYLWQTDVRAIAARQEEEKWNYNLEINTPIIRIYKFGTKEHNKIQTRSPMTGGTTAPLSLRLGNGARQRYSYYRRLPAGPKIACFRAQNVH